jgi:hypothetical protein
MKSDSGTNADNEAVEVLAGFIYAQMNIDRRPMDVAIEMARNYLADIRRVLIEQNLRRPEDAREPEPTLWKTLDGVIADLDDVATTLAEAKEEPPPESHQKLREAEKDIAKVTDKLERIEEERRA